MANALNKVNSGGIEDGSIVNADVKSDAAIAGSKLADNAVGLAQMAGGTDGNLITYDTSGDPAHVTTGNAGQILTSNGAGAAPTFQAAPTSGATLSGSTDNTVVTVTGANAMQGEANLTYNGTALNLAGTNSEIHLMGSGTCDHSIAAPSGTNDVVVTANKDAENVTANIVFKSSGSGGGAVSEKARIDSAGRLQVNQTANITGQAKLEVTADGSNANPEYSYGIGVTDTQAYNVSNGPGVGIGFNVKYNNGGSTALIGGIRGYKVNTTDGDYSGGLQFYTRANGAGAAKAMQIDSSGYVTKPKHPILQRGNNTAKDGVIVEYDYGVIDQGSNWDGTNHRFTAPVAGIYFVGLYGMSNSSQATMDIEVNKNGSGYNAIVPYSTMSSGSTYHHFCGLGTIELAVNDYVSVECNTGDMYYNSGGRHGGLTIFLIG